ncbi:Homoserine kinase [compost metagenome]
MLAKAQVDNGPVYRPYYELENTHPSCSLDKVVQFCKAPPAGFTKHRQELEAIAEQIVVFKDKVSQLIELPHQLVHGDLNASNVLADSQGHISAILDFEFVTIDLRVMELAVCLSDLIQPEQEEQGMWTRIESLITGYGSLMELTMGEIEVVPILVQLRRLDVFIHFLGRYWDGIDQPDILEQQIVSTATNTRWLTLYQDQLCALLKRRIVQEHE